MGLNLGYKVDVAVIDSHNSFLVPENSSHHLVEGPLRLEFDWTS